MQRGEMIAALKHFAVYSRGWRALIYELHPLIKAWAGGTQPEAEDDV